MIASVILLSVVGALLAVLVVLRLGGVDGTRHTAAGVALVPYATVVGAVVAGLALALRWWWLGGALAALTLVLLGCLVSRLVPRSRHDGVRLRVMASNLYLGRGDVKTVVELVRRQDVDLLALVELTPECAEEFARAGLFELLPHQVMRSDAGGGGAAIAARHPLTELSLVGPTTLAQPSALVDLGDGGAVEFVAVHPVPPTYSARTWRAELAALPGCGPGCGPAVRVLAGDFNATVDHGSFRRLLRRGYVDAACRRGAGLRPTWRLGRFPLVTLDHVLVDRRASVNSFRAFDIPASDHKAVCAELLLPRVRDQR